MTRRHPAASGGGARTAAADFAAPASGALAAAIEAGARLFAEQPWRAARLIRGADAMTAPELRAALARRRAAGPPADLNLGIALAQLSLALEAPTFAEAWGAWRASPGEE